MLFMMGRNWEDWGLSFSAMNKVVIRQMACEGIVFDLGTEFKVKIAM